MLHVRAGGVGRVVLDRAEHLERRHSPRRARAGSAARPRPRCGPRASGTARAGARGRAGRRSRRAPGTASAITCTILRANSRSTTVSTAWPATNVTISRGLSSPKCVAEVGQQPPRGEQHQHRVVALERREDVGVGLERREPVDAHVAGAAAALAAGLDRLGRVPARGGLHPRSQRLELAPLALGGLVSALQHLVELLEQLGLGEVQRVGLRQQRHQPALVGAVVEDRHLLARPVAELAPPQPVADGDRQRGLGGADRRAGDAHPPLDERPQHREEALVGVLDRARVHALGR